MNLPTETAHLSEEALDSILIGAGTPDDERHVAGCESCSGRLAEFRMSLATFNQASASWSVARSNSISRELTPRKSSHSVAAWSLASVTMLAVAVSLTSHLHPSSLDFGALGGHETQASIQQTPNQQQEIATDNAMLVAIDSELSQPVQSPVVVYGDGESAGPKAGGREVRD